MNFWGTVISKVSLINNGEDRRYIGTDEWRYTGNIGIQLESWSENNL